MNYRRLFIMRKDLNMSTGKLAAQVSHCAEAYWTRMIARFSKSNNCSYVHSNSTFSKTAVCFPVEVEEDVLNFYIGATFTKTICEAKNKAQLLKAKDIAENMGLVQDKDFGLIYDKCLTELTPEEEDGTTLTGIWFCPMPDDKAHEISKKYQLYKN